MVIVNKNFYYQMNKHKCNFTSKLYNAREFTFIKNNEYHRYYGPSWLSRVNNDKYWDFNNKEYGNSYCKYNQKQFLKDIGKSWLL